VINPAEQQALSSRISRPSPQIAEDEKRAGQAHGEYFNNHAVSLNAKGETWTALYYLDKASRVAPKQPEPLINMALILTQMDLGFPAGRLFKKAYQLDPDNEYLRQAMELAIEKQVLPPDFYKSMPLPARKGT
jgi:tetratricopeptide (TPR) repeat protein